MKMNYLLKNSRNRRKTYLFPLIGLLLFVSFIALFQWIFPKALPSIFSAIASPLWNSKVAITESVQNVGKSKDDLINENILLEQKLAELSAQKIIIDTLESENAELRSVLSRLGDKKALLATVLQRPPRTPYDTMILDVGNQDGVKNQSKVLYGGHILIGEIFEVLPNVSKVKLYSTAGEKFDARIGSTSIETVITGRGGGSFEAILPKELSVKEGDGVYIPHLTPLLFGTVVSKVPDIESSFEKILIELPINIYEIRFVQVEK
jgi:cell shape-determining protein MreC